MKYILAHIPFSDAGEKAAQAACFIAEQVGAALLLIQKEGYVPVKKKRSSAIAFNQSFVAEEEHTGNGSAAKFIERVRTGAKADGIPVRCVAADDLSEKPAKGKIAPHEIGLIVSHVNDGEDGADCLEDGFLGPLQKASCPILRVDGHHSIGSVKKIGYITDLRYCDIATLSPLINMFKPFEAEWIIIHVSASGLPDIENEYAEKLFTTQILPKLNYKKAMLINLFGKDIASDLKNVAQVFKPDMIALPSNKYWCYGRLFPGHHEQKKSNTGIPLLFAKQ